MRCFPFLHGVKRECTGTPKAKSSISTSAGDEVNRSESDLNSQNVSETMSIKAQSSISTFTDGEAKGSESEVNSWSVSETRTRKAQSSISTSADGEVKGCESELNLRDVSDASAESSARANFPNVPQRPSNLREFTVSDLRSSTRNFSHSTLIGEGGFGCVYKGTIKSTEELSKKLKVAVKQMNRRGTQGHKEWVTEVKFLGVVEHPNLVKLLGYCAADDERGIQRFLIYEYMPNRSVYDHLSTQSGKTLSWAWRMRIARDTARGLAYLHEEMDFQIIFRDFKSSNILLDEQWNAKLSDFGLARLGPTEGLTHVSTAVVGTIGYAAPEYVHTGRLTSKNDVWSYGVFLYELITGRRPMDHNLPRSQQKLLEWVKPYRSDAKKFHLIVDSRLEGKKIAKSAYKLAKVANQCLALRPKTRPKMSEVLEMVTEILEEESEVMVGCEGPLISFESAGTTGDSKTGDEERTTDFKSGEAGWCCCRLWTAKVVESRCFHCISGLLCRTEMPD